MAGRPPVSVLLPTTSWTDASGGLAAQLEGHGELLIIYNVEDNPLTERQHTPEDVRLIAAGEPECCSGTDQCHRRYTHRDGGVTTPF